MAERSSATAKKMQDAALEVSTLQKRGRRRLVGAIALVLLAVIVLPMVFDPEPRPTAPLVNIRIPSEEGGKFTPKVIPGGGSAVEITQDRPLESPVAAPVSAAPAVQAVPLDKPAAKTEPAKTEPAKAVARPDAKAAESAKPVDKPVAKSAQKPAGKVAEKPAGKVAEKPAAKVAEKPAAKVAEKPAAKVTEKPVDAAATGDAVVFQVGAFATPEKVKEIVDQLRVAKLPHYTESVAIATGSVTRVRLGPFATKEAAERGLERAKALGLNPVNVAPR